MYQDKVNEISEKTGIEPFDVDIFTFESFHISFKHSRVGQGWNIIDDYPVSYEELEEAIQVAGYGTGYIPPYRRYIKRFGQLEDWLEEVGVHKIDVDDCIRETVLVLCGGYPDCSYSLYLAFVDVADKAESFVLGELKRYSGERSVEGYVQAIERLEQVGHGFNLLVCGVSVRRENPFYREYRDALMLNMIDWLSWQEELVDIEPIVKLTGSIPAYSDIKSFLCFLQDYQESLIL